MKIASLLVAFVASAALAAAAAPTYCNDAPGLIKVFNERKAWLAKLADKRYDELEGFFGAIQRDYESGSRSDAEVGAWFDAFETPHPRYTPLLEEWTTRFPRSYAARRALAEHLLAVAWAKRGGKYASETSETQMTGMKAELERMIDVLNQGDRLTRKPTTSYGLRIALVRTLVGNREVQAVFEEAERLDPANSTAKAAYIFASARKWGGDGAALKRFYDGFLASGASPDLKKFVQYQVVMVVADTAREDERRDVAIDGYERAAALCPAYVKPLEHLLRLYKEADNAEAIRRTATRYLELLPNSGWALVKLASAQGRLDLNEESFRNYQRAAELGERTGVEGVAWHYAKGAAVKRDAERALQLYNVVLERGGTHVRPQIERLRRELGK